MILRPFPTQTMLMAFIKGEQKKDPVTGCFDPGTSTGLRCSPCLTWCWDRTQAGPVHMPPAADGGEKPPPSLCQGFTGAQWGEQGKFIPFSAQSNDFGSEQF